MMGSDTERKILRIIQNRHGFNWHKPDLSGLEQRSQRSLREVRKALRSLLAQGRIEVRDGWMRITGV